jgi:hypothetical protein
VVQLQKSLDGGENWITVREYTRVSTTEEGNLDYSGSESEENVLYRARVQPVSGKIRYKLEALGYTKVNIFRITVFSETHTVRAKWLPDKFEASSRPILINDDIDPKNTLDWNLGAWGGASGYPACGVFYQERFVLAGSREQPQTIWFSRTGDYENFGVTEPLSDEDAVTITIASDDNDGIHSILAMTDILAFTPTGEWSISGSGENGAISPSAIVAHKQSRIGSSPASPLIVGGQVIMVQTMRGEIQSMQYLFEYDGYRGSNISILSRHLFEWLETRGSTPPDRRIRYMAYQQIPDSLLWVVLEDGTAATCTLQAEHEMTAWGRQETEGSIGDVCAVPGERHSELWAAVRRGGVWGIERLAERTPEDTFKDAGTYSYESCLETLRINLDGQNGSMMASKKYIPRLAVYTLRSSSARVAPKSDRARVYDRRLTFEYSSGMSGAELLLDGGFERDAGIQIWNDGDEPLTILALSPVIVSGG